MSSWECTRTLVGASIYFSAEPAGKSLSALPPVRALPSARNNILGGIAMVIAYDAVPNTATSVAPRRQVQPGLTKLRELDCRRCDTRLIMGHYEPTCPCCGNADYSNTRDMAPRWQRRSIVSSATRNVFRYVGDSVHLAETLTYAELVRQRNRAVYAVDCPFCQEAMEETSLSGMRPEAREHRFRCPAGHRVSLVPTSRGMLGWR